MREALECAKRWLYGMLQFCDRRTRGEEIRVPALSAFGTVDRISAALATPARNCEVSRDAKKTIERCLASLNVESSSASFDAGVCAAIGWMLAPAEGGDHA